MKGGTPTRFGFLLVSCLSITLVGCGHGADEEATSAWESVQRCMADNGVSNFDGHAQPGVIEGDDVIPPSDFADAPGGWLIAYIRKDQRLHLFFYSDAGETARHEEKASKTYEGPVGARGNTVFAFDKPPNSREAALLASCLKPVAIVHAY